MTQPHILELAFGLGLLANGILFVYQIMRALKRKSILEEHDTNIEGVTFKDIVDKIPAHIYWKDLNGRCLGASELQYKNLGLSKQEYIGKTDFDIFSREVAEKIIAADRQVLSTGLSLVCEEASPHTDGSERLSLSHKIPFKNKHGKVVALLGVSVDVHDIRKKEIERKNLLESIIALMPGHVYWCDRDGVWQGCNDLQAKSAGLASRLEIIGMRNKDLPWNMRAHSVPEFVDRINEEVMSSGRAIELEEPLSYLNGENGFCLSSKAPLYDANGNVVGMLGISIDTTEKRKAEQALKEAKEKAEAMNAAALQVAHDIRSPLAAISMLTQSCDKLPEKHRICLREAIERINDIANQLLVEHGKAVAPVESGILSPVMVYAALLSIISSKRVEYQNSKAKINFEANAEAYFSFVRADIIELKRMVSNLINNAIEACNSDSAEVQVAVNKSGSHLIISVIDTGRGMSEEKIQQILNDDIVTTEKETGFGLGLTHVKKMLKKFDAKLSIHSELTKGTTMELIFNLIPAPDWMASTIQVNADDSIIVLDDDQSIHGAWDEIFSNILKENPRLKLTHFSHANECIQAINSCEKPERLLLLTDYELIGQAMNGLDVIEQTKPQRAILVTSHYESQEVLKRANRLGTRILPKMLASHVTITVNSK